VNWRLADVITVIHPTIKDYLCGRLGVPPKRVTVIPLGIETDRYKRADRDACRARLGFGPEPVFVFVGRLAAVKQVPQLIEAFLAVMSRRRGGARLLVVGDGADRGRCEQLRAAHTYGGLVTLAGEQVDTRPFLSASDVFVLTSRSEGTPRALLEAMSTGLPAICSAVGGIPDMLAGRGWVTPPGDRAAFEAALDQVLEQPAAIIPLGARCREYVIANYEAAGVVDRFREILLP